MKPTRLAVLAALAVGLALPVSARPAGHRGPATPAAAVAPAPAKPRNIVIFIADGLRYSSVTPETAPTMYRIRKEGVDFSNSHAMYPTVTTANASAIASGHYLGDTGDYGNTLSFEFPIHCQIGAPVTITFLEDDCVLRSVKAHFGAGYMGQVTLPEAAHNAGYNTVLIGKRGPTAIQWLAALDSQDDDVDGPLGVLVDDSTNHPAGLDKMPTMSTILRGDYGNDVFGVTGAGAPPFTTTPNLAQQAWLQSLTVQELIPSLVNHGKPFLLLFWSRDPDATQHGAVDSTGRIVPGINSIDAHNAIYNADTNLKGLLDALKLWGLDKNTDVFVTADHGFSTIGKGIPTPDGRLPISSLSQGFVAIQVAQWLGDQNLYDPDHENLQIDRSNGERPNSGSAIIGPSADHPKALVVSNGGSDFIYVPDGPDRRATVKLIFDKLLEQPYVGSLFVNDDVIAGGNRLDFAGALPMSSVNLMGASTMPRPAIVIGFRSFVAKDCTLGEQLCAVEIADTGLQTGQGMHGTFSRADTRNFMAAIGPDFKKGYADPTPVSNADIAPTLAHIIGATLSGPGTLTGRIATEALAGGKPVAFTPKTLPSPAAANGIRTVLEYQEVGTVHYFDAAGIPGRIVGLKAK
jgi:arylsulfatase A-like enzyme